MDKEKILSYANQLVKENKVLLEESVINIDVDETILLTGIDTGLNRIIRLIKQQ